MVLVWWPFSKTSWLSLYHSGSKVMEVVMITGAMGPAKRQSNRHHQHIDTQLFQAGCPFVSTPTVSKH